MEVAALQLNDTFWLNHLKVEKKSMHEIQWILNNAIVWKLLKTVKLEYIREAIICIIEQGLHRCNKHLKNI